MPERSHPTDCAAPRLTVAIAALAVLAAGRPRRIVVEGTSMTPAFAPGERLLVVRLPLRPGHPVAVRDPRHPARILVKRVHAVTDHDIEVRGDNRTASTDSRHFGPVPRRLVLGRVVYRYFPPGRTGWRP